jgi:hypothetical protein
VAVLNERINSPGWATYLRVSDKDKQTPERSFAMQRQRIVDEFSTENSEECSLEYPSVGRQRASSMLDSFILLCYFTISILPFY